MYLYDVEIGTHTPAGANIPSQMWFLFWFVVVLVGLLLLILDPGDPAMAADSCEPQALCHDPEYAVPTSRDILTPADSDPTFPLCGVPNGVTGLPRPVLPSTGPGGH